MEAVPSWKKWGLSFQNFLAALQHRSSSLHSLCFLTDRTRLTFFFFLSIKASLQAP